MAKSTMLKVAKINGQGALVPADRYAYEDMRSRGWKVGQIVKAKLSDPRTYWRLKYAHKLGALFYTNLEVLADYQEAHAALKHLQFLSGIECDEQQITIDYHDMKVPCLCRQARSLAYDEMGEERFAKFVHAIKEFVVREYWPTATSESIEEMLETME